MKIAPPSNFFYFILLLVYISPRSVTGIETHVWYYQGSVSQTCNIFNETWNGSPLTPLQYQPIYTPYSYNLRNTTGMLTLGYGVSCLFTRSHEIFYDKECNNDEDSRGPRPYGYIMYNPDIRYSSWICLGEESRISRYHAAYATITMYDLPSYYTENNVVNIHRKVTCSVVCIIGGQQIHRSNTTYSTTVGVTTSVLCLQLDTLNTYNGVQYTMKWIEAEPLPYDLVGATAIYSNGTLFVIGGIRGNYDYNTTSSILEADIDVNTCLPFHWRNYGYSNTSRIGNQNLIHNWSSLPSTRDVFENRTFIWVTEGPPAYPIMTNDIYFYDLSIVYPPSYYPVILTGGGITVPLSLSFVPFTFTIKEFYASDANHDSYYISLNPLASDMITLTNTTEYMIDQAITAAQNMAVPIELNFPTSANDWLDHLIIFDLTNRNDSRGTVFNIDNDPFHRTYKWIYHHSNTMYSMYTSRTPTLKWFWMNSNEIVAGRDNGYNSEVSETLPVGSNIVFTFIGNSGDYLFLGSDIFLVGPYIGYVHRCIPCIDE